MNLDVNVNETDQAYVLTSLKQFQDWTPVHDIALNSVFAYILANSSANYLCKIKPSCITHGHKINIFSIILRVHYVVTIYSTESWFSKDSLSRKASFVFKCVLLNFVTWFI
jgi:hypothetical protein